jgi:TolB-like protein
VVLPFVNIGGSAQDDAFVDGITETLTTDLSRSSGVFAISRSTAFAYKGKPMDIRQIGRELGVRYVLEGSVQNAGERIRLNAQLVDAESGAHLWAERFDKQRTDLLDMQDEVTTRLARAVHIALIAAESRRAARGHADRLDAVDYTLCGLAVWNQPLSVETARQARDFFEAALRLDEHNIGALLGLANAHMWEVRSYASADRAGQIRAAEAAVTKALELVPDSADAHVTYGTVLYAMRAPERALREFQLAIDLDSNLAVAHAFLGNIKFVLGRAGETIGHVKEAMRLSPRDPLLFHLVFPDRDRRCLSRADSPRGREPTQIGRNLPQLAARPVRLGRLVGAGRVARGVRRSLCGRPASRAQLHDRQVPHRSSERQPGVSGAARIPLSGPAFGGSAGGLDPGRVIPPDTQHADRPRPMCRNRLAGATASVNHHPVTSAPQRHPPARSA